MSKAKGQGQGRGVVAMTTGGGGGEAKDVSGDGEPMEVAESAESPMEANEEEEAEEDRYKSEATFRYVLDKATEFSQGHETRLSPPEYVRGLPWKIMAIPRDTRERRKALGFFLQCNADAEAPDNRSWNCSAHATLRIISQKDGVPNSEKKINHTFYAKENDWGFSQFIHLDQLLEAESGLIKDDAVILEVSVSADAPHGVQWDSKKHTGYIGLKNQGATCYMNSLLQTLFFTNKLRKAVYQMPTETDDPAKSVALAMQRVFYELQHSDRPVPTKKLTRSFGWDTFESFLQHDVQELCRVLLDNLESKMKGTSVEGTIPKLFEGRMKSFIRCKNVDFESKREEAFYDIQLNIKGKRDIVESFRDYVETETLDGENKYDAGDYGLQEAEKGIKFMRFPPVLHLQLMRFQYDPLHDSNVKINQRFEFPERLDLSEFLEEKEETAAEYILHAVLVHSGDFHGGHYVVFLNPKGNGRWCKFDDDVVSRATPTEAIDANYGGDEPELPQRACTSAYMLVYVRTSAIPDVVAPGLPVPVPAPLKARLEEERAQDAVRKKEKIEAHLYTHVLIVAEDALTPHRSFDLFDPDAVESTARSFRVRKQAPIQELYQTIGEAYGLTPLQQFRLWVFQTRRNRTFRPTELLTVEKGPPLSSPHQRPLRAPPTVEEHLRDEKNFVFMETQDLTKQPSPPLPDFDTDNELLVFLKFYDPATDTASYAGHSVFTLRSTLSEYAPDLAKRAHLPRNTPLFLYEEIAPGLMEPRDAGQAVSDAFSGQGEQRDLEDGVIVVYQKADAHARKASEHFQDLYHRLLLDLVDRDAADPEKATTTFPGSLMWSYLQITTELGKRIDWDPEKIQLFKPTHYRDSPGSALPFHNAETPLLNLLNPHAGRQLPPRTARQKLFYQKVPVRIAELERRQPIKLQWLETWAPGEGGAKDWRGMRTLELVVYPDKAGTVRTILDEVKSQVSLAPGGSGRLRLLQLSPSATQAAKIQSVLAPEDLIEKIAGRMPAMVSLRAEEVPLDQLSVDAKTELLLPVAHFYKDPLSSFGTPFLIKVKAGEKFSSVRKRVQDMLAVSDKDFEKFKFALVKPSQMKPSYLEDMDNCTVNLSDLSLPPGNTGIRPWLGLDHVNKQRASSRGYVPEKAIVIHN